MNRALLLLSNLGCVAHLYVLIYTHHYATFNWYILTTVNTNTSTAAAFLFVDFFLFYDCLPDFFVFLTFLTSTSS